MQLNGRSESYRGRPDGRLRKIAPIALLAILAHAMPLTAADLSQLPQPLKDKVEQARSSCTEAGNGEFALEWGAVKRVDLGGGNDLDWVLNEAGFACSTAVSLYCGTGGCMSHFLVGDKLQSQLNQGWDMATFGPHRVLLANVHGSNCDGINPTPCVTASTWDVEGERWRSAMAVWE